MIETLSGLGERVVAVRARGKVTAKDFQDVLLPAVEAATQDGKRARLLYVLGPEFDGLEVGAMLHDAKVGLGHLSDFERIAVVTDRDWIAHSLRVTAFLIPAAVRLFAPDQLEEAKRWIVEPAPDPLTIDTQIKGDTALLRVTLRGALDLASERELVQTASRSIEQATKVRLLLHAEDFHGWSDLKALWMHLKFVAELRSKIERAAVVGHAPWQKRLIATARAALGVPVRFFTETELAQAEAWVQAA
jgi:hypothetical protein